MACSFRHIFGEPGEGVRTSRVFGMASFDLGLTILSALLIAWARSRTSRQMITASVFWLVLLMFMSLAVHVAVGVDTALTVRVRGHPSACSL